MAMTHGDDRAVFRSDLGADDRQILVRDERQDRACEFRRRAVAMITRSPASRCLRSTSSAIGSNRGLIDSVCAAT
jgi:hypothetical protein